MYFITNNENYIVAASKDFLEQSGSRDLCAIAASFKDGVFSLEDETKSFHAHNFEDYEYKESELYSSFGTLTLYSISKKVTPIDKATLEDENISYLKQLKDGKISKSDNEFSIPTIEALHKKGKEEENKEIESNTTQNKVTISKENITEERQISSKQEEESQEQAKEPQNVENNENVQEETGFETIKLFGHTSEESSEDEEKESIKLFDYDTTEQEVLKSVKATQEEPETINIDGDKKDKQEPRAVENFIEEQREEPNTLKSPAKENTKVEEESTIELNNLISLNDVKTLDETQLQLGDDESNKVHEEKIVEIPTTIIESEEEEPVQNEKTAIDKLKEKLFPWGASSNKKIELEENEVIKTASDLVKKEKLEENILKENNEEAFDKIQEPLPIIEEAIEKDKAIDTSVDVKIPLEEPEETIQSTVSKEKDHLLKEEKKEKYFEEKHSQKEEQAGISLEEQELAELKAMHLENQVMKSATQLPQEKELEGKLENTTAQKIPLKKDNSQLYYKIIEMQVNSINLERNAEKLNVDLDSYKMLIDNYLEELENYSEDLKNRVHSTITMLADAGELLSLNVISKKLNELSIASEPATPLRDLILLTSLLRDKIENKTQTVVEEEFKESAPERIEAQAGEQEITHKLFEITTAQELLSKIPAESISYNPQKAADELNLPIALILEFADDFVTQAKEHLSQMVKAYKEGDIKTLQTTAHMLKGAASNLRIDPLAENLFTIQKLQSLSSAEELIKEFVARLKGLEAKLKIIEGISNED